MPSPILRPKTLPQSITGYVIGVKSMKTCKVRTENIKMHSIIKKPVIHHINYLVHDPDQKAVVGDFVKIELAKEDISKRKWYNLGEIIRPAQRYVDENGKLHTQAVDVTAFSRFTAGLREKPETGSDPKAQQSNSVEDGGASKDA